MLLRLFQDEQPRFQHTYDVLVRRLQAPRSRQTADKMAGIFQRFSAERARQHFPEEVYQHVVYDKFYAIATLQGQYFLLADTFRQHWQARRKALESLLALQVSSDPIFVWYLALAEALFPRHLVLANALDAASAMAYVYEHLKAILELEQSRMAARVPCIS